MAKKLKKILKSFTLIELVIVIAIIAVLGASAFLVLSQWMSKSRDTRKIADLGTIDTAINVSITSNDKLPTPDNKADITFANSKIWEVGYFGDAAVKQMGGTLTKSPTDPTTKEWYRYAQWNNTKYQLGTIIENEQFSRFANRVYANEYFTRLQGNYNQTIIIAKVGSDDVIIPAPSLIIDEISEGTQELDEEYFWTNKNSYNLGQEQTNIIQVQSLFSGNINDLKDPTNFDNFKTKFANAFSGTVYLKELTSDLDDEKLEEIVNSELKKIGNQTVAVQYLGCDGTVHGQTKIFFKENNVSFGQSCDVQRKEFKCENGVWKDGTNNADLDTYKYFTCTVGPANNCESTTSNQTSLSGLNITFNIPATEHGLGFNVEQSVNENNGTYKYSLQGNCNNGILESIVLGNPIVQSCDTNYEELNGNCIETRWIGDASNGYSFMKKGSQVYPKSCNDLLVSNAPNYKIGDNNAYNGTKFNNGIYWIKPDVNAAYKVYCDMTTEGGGWTWIIKKKVQRSTWNPLLVSGLPTDDNYSIFPNLASINYSRFLLYDLGANQYKMVEKTIEPANYTSRMITIGKDGAKYYYLGFGNSTHSQYRGLYLRLDSTNGTQTSGAWCGTNSGIRGQTGGDASGCHHNSINYYRTSNVGESAIRSGNSVATLPAGKTFLILMVK